MNNCANVRSTSASCRNLNEPVLPLSAKTGREQAQQRRSLFDHLIGQLLKVQRHVETKSLGDL
jgi:hypothetical protein